MNAISSNVTTTNASAFRLGKQYECARYDRLQGHNQDGKSQRLDTSAGAVIHIETLVLASHCLAYQPAVAILFESSRQLHYRRNDVS